MTKPITLTVCKADPIGRKVHGAPVFGAVLSITEDLPELGADGTLDDWYAFCEEQAVVVVSALNQLPQGVRRRVMALLVRDFADREAFGGTD